MASATQNADGTHLERFLEAPAQHLSGYGVFFGDERQEGGEPLPTGSLRHDGGLQASETLKNIFQDFGNGYQLKTTVSLSTLRSGTSAGAKVLGGQVSQATTKTGQGMALSAGPMANDTLSGTAFQYSTGTYVSQSGAFFAAYM